MKIGHHVMDLALATSFENIDDNIGIFQTEFKKSLSEAFSVPEESIELSLVRAATENDVYIEIKVFDDSLDTDVKIPDHQKYFEPYKKFIESLETFRYYQRYEIKLANPERKVPFDIHDSMLEKDLDIFEKNDTTPLSLLSVPFFPSSSLIDTIDTEIHHIFQLRILQKTIGNSYEDIGLLVEQMRSLSKNVFGLDEDDIIIYSMRQDTPRSVTLQYIFYPSPNDLSAKMKLWESAIASEDPRIKSIFKQVDFKYPPVQHLMQNFETTTVAPNLIVSKSTDGSRNSVGIIIGSVCGSIVALAILGGGGYYLKKKIDAKKQNQENHHGYSDDDDDDDDDRSYHGASSSAPHAV